MRDCWLRVIVFLHTGFLVVASLLTCTAARADGFPWQDDPNGPILLGTRSVNGNDLTWTLGVQNVGAAHDIGMVIPIFQVFGSGSTPALQWDPTQNGWDGTVNGNSLLVTVTSPTGLLPWSDVADFSGVTQENFTFFGQTTNPAYSYPFIDLGIVQPNQTVFTTFDFLFTWGGNGSGVPPRGITPGNCGSETSCTSLLFESVAFIPEPNTLVLLGTGLLGVMSLRRKRAA